MSRIVATTPPEQPAVSSIGLIVVVSLATQKISPVPRHILDAMDETAKLGPIPPEMLASADPDLANAANGIKKKLED